MTYPTFKEVKRSIKTYTFRAFGESFKVDIETTKKEFSAWLYSDHYCVKTLMFGIPKKQPYNGEKTTYDEFLSLVESNILEYCLTYIQEVILK